MSKKFVTIKCERNHEKAKKRWAKLNAPTAAKYPLPPMVSDFEMRISCVI